MIDYVEATRAMLGLALEEAARTVFLAGGDPIELARALVPALREVADFYAKAIDAWEAAGADAELAAVISGSALFTPEQTRRWLAGESVKQIVGGPPR